LKTTDIQKLNKTRKLTLASIHLKYQVKALKYWSI